MKYILDTNVYIGAFHSESRRVQFQQVFFPLLPATFLSAVVAYELSVNARDRHTQDLLNEYIAPMRRAGRIVAPAFDDWITASEIITAIGQGEKRWKSKLPLLLNDALIAICARRIGATLLTYNEADFCLIHRHKDFSLQILKG